LGILETNFPPTYKFGIVRFSQTNRVRKFHAKFTLIHSPENLSPWRDSNPGSPCEAVVVEDAARDAHVFAGNLVAALWTLVALKKKLSLLKSVAPKKIVTVENEYRHITEKIVQQKISENCRIENICHNEMA
jgi:hypothetical protein